MKSLSVTIQINATKQYFPVVLFIMLYKVVLTIESAGEILNLITQMKATEDMRNIPVVLFPMLHKVVMSLLTSTSVVVHVHS